MKKINIAEILKDCPKGMELDCTMFDDVKFISVEEYDKPICIKTGDIFRYLTKFGTWTFDKNAKCVIYPKCKTTWEGFQRPFKDGDVVTNIEGEIIIYKEITTSGYCGSFVSLDRYNQLIPHYESYLTDCIRLSTEKEKQKLFDAIKANGYKWNPETKTLEKLIEPKFKVGDKVKNKDGYVIDIIEIDTNKEEFKYKTPIGAIGEISFNQQNNYELVPNKFDITTLIPFESRVLIRDEKTELWSPAIWGCLRKNEMDVFPYIVVGGLSFNQCIPFENNEHLLGTTKDCDDFYKTWKQL